MKSFDECPGILELVLGTCWLSRFELSRLAPGSAVLTDRVAGTPFELRYNGERIADAETALIAYAEAARVAARIVSLESSSLPAPEPVRGADLAGLLPVTVVLGGAAARLSDLAGLGPMSLIELGIEARAEGGAWRCAANFRVAGIEAGSGTAAVSGENMALVVESVSPALLSPPFASSPFDLTGRVLEPGQTARPVKPYDFSKPDCFTRRQIDSAAALHEAALHSLSVLAPQAASGLRVSLVDQLNFTEFLESLPSGTSVLAAPATGPSRPAVRPEDRPERLFFAAVPLSAAYPADAAAAAVRDSLERPVGGPVFLSGPLLDAEEGAVLAALRDAWRRLGGVQPRGGSRLTREKDLAAAVRSFAPHAGEWEMVILVEFASEAGTSLRVAYPLRTLEGVLAALDS